MTKKEIKNIAKRIANAEQIISTSNDKNEIDLAKNEICGLTNRIQSVDDMMKIDDLVQEFLKEKD